MPSAQSSVRVVRRGVRAALIALVLTQLSCLGLTEVKPIDVAFITTEAADDGGTAGLRVSGVFVRVTGINADIGSPENCWDLPYTTSSNNGANVSIDAGAALTATVSGNTQSISRRTVFGQYSYPAPLSLLAYTPGDTLRVDVPGASGGYPASQIALRTAEALVMTPVTVPPSNAPMNIAWTPTAVGGSVLTVSLRYPGTGAFAGTRHVYCVFLDDGSASVPAFLLPPFLAADPAERTMVFTRVRIAVDVVAGNQRVVTYSYYALPLPQVVE